MLKPSPAPDINVTPIVTTELSGWGRLPRVRARVARPENLSAVDLGIDRHVLARGLGRSYGDAALAAEGVVILTERLNRFLEFDSRTGLVRAEAGTTLAEVLETFIPRGWFPEVTPGTKFVTLGGCVAADVHGKNHHRVGSFGAHVAGLELLLADGRIARCSPDVNSELFHASVGGMGLTGFITEVAFRLRPIETSYMMVRHRASRDLDESLAVFEDAALDDEYTVSWIDCSARGRHLGRGILIRGQHARATELPRERRELAAYDARTAFDFPVDLPSWAINSLTASVFNRSYYQRQARRRGPFFASLDSFFYPLDVIGRWNRAYGRAGLVQYQCVLPPQGAERGLRQLFEALAASPVPATLGVLKRFGAEGAGLLSFPVDGYTLAIDFPARAEGLTALLDRFDEIVLEHDGRVYLAKDARLTPEIFRRMYPRFREWRKVKASVDPDNRFSSSLSRRLGLTP
jgi:FAD/FMN-containing dehydrogenase